MMRPPPAQEKNPRNFSSVDSLSTKAACPVIVLSLDHVYTSRHHDSVGKGKIAKFALLVVYI